MSSEESESSSPTLVNSVESNSETLIIKWGDTGTCCNGEVIISLPRGPFDGILVQAPPYEIDAVVGSPGYPNQEFKDAHINDALVLEAKHKYEVRIVDFHESGTNQEIEFLITRIDN